MKKIPSGKIIEWVIKLLAVVVLFRLGYIGGNHIYNCIALFSSGMSFWILITEIDRYLEERRAAKENELINQIGED